MKLQLITGLSNLLLESLKSGLGNQTKGYLLLTLPVNITVAEAELLL